MTLPCPTCGHVARPAVPDKRAQAWRVRIRLYRAGQSVPEADTDPELPEGAAGSTVLSGLSAVAEELASLAALFHAGQRVTGLDPVNLTRRIASLRVSLQRGSGTAVWRVDYLIETPPLSNYLGLSVPRGWLARVDVVREPS